MSGGMRVVFNGVRGSTPCAGPAYTRFGGHSSSVAIESDDAPPILFDLGTGVRPYASRCSGEFHGTVLLSHLHWDHVQGLPFFTPLHMEGSTLDVFGPRQDEGQLGDVFAQMMRPPFFPIRPADLPADIRFHDTGEDDFPVGLAKVRSRWVRHVGNTLGFRIEWNGASVAYIPDHGPGTVVTDADDYIPPGILELCDGVDLLIHDAQHTTEEYEPKRHWGHCTVEYALHVAREAGVRSLVLFHHDPLHGDDAMDRIASEARDRAAEMGIPELIVARDRLQLHLAAHPAAQSASEAR